jgi:hypothetical protein
MGDEYETLAVIDAAWHAANPIGSGHPSIDGNWWPLPLRCSSVRRWSRKRRLCWFGALDVKLHALAALSCHLFERTLELLGVISSRRDRHSSTHWNHAVRMRYCRRKLE